MEANLLELVSAGVVLSASSIPIYLIYSVRAQRQRLLSSILLAALLNFAALSILESFELTNYQIVAKLFFITSALFLVVTYFVFQLRANHVLVGGLFGVAMIVAFGTWIAGEIVEVSYLSGENSKTLDSITSMLMAGFGGFLFARYFWLRSIMPIETKHLKEK